ncbi:MAG: hypothetical protein RDU24_11895 [Humidesulfovibrio sp.]|uniref:hypothetical protein n=1 Tax=Humidesulfovibrio sp. TaxID=2910988 RepID=UPI0027F38FF9|nr:hypothetical protein [Humidesulfovibrio sp.]MDQ7836076.1 hypothetical protein [Humidesulfovibrio sp.]
MILLHHPEVELSRELLAQLPADCGCVDWTSELQREEYQAQDGLPPSAFPSVLVDVPAYAEDRPMIGPDGEFLGMEVVAVPAHQELLRLPASWAAVASFTASVEERALLLPAG